jgi:superfamily II DNA/RNA helicase
MKKPPSTVPARTASVAASRTATPRPAAPTQPRTTKPRTTKRAEDPRRKPAAPAPKAAKAVTRAKKAATGAKKAAGSKPASLAKPTTSATKAAPVKPAKASKSAKPSKPLPKPAPVAKKAAAPAKPLPVAKKSAAPTNARPAPKKPVPAKSVKAAGPAKAAAPAKPAKSQAPAKPTKAPTKPVRSVPTSALQPKPSKLTKTAAPKKPSKLAKPAVDGAVAPQTGSGFASLGVPPLVLQELDRRGIAAPFPVQVLCIPDALAGRDVCGQAKTGSGKTLAFGIPLVATVPRAKPKHPTALVLVPTRELAAQVDSELKWLGAATGVRVVAIYGGSSFDVQREAINKGVEIVVATPGRLIDLMGRGDINLGSIQTLVLDEADRMCDMGFLPNVEWLLRHMPKERQTLLFSATLGSDVNYLVRHELRDPIRHAVASDTVTVEQSHHRFLRVHEMDKIKVTAAILRSCDRAIVFCNTKRACDRLSDALSDEGLAVKAIHGDLDQSRRERALRQFGAGQIHALVATDVAARGLHIEAVEIVIQYDPPDDHKTYLHRSGRTARAGAEGVVATLFVWNQEPDIRKLQKRVGMNEAMHEVFSNDKRLANLAAWTS